MNPPVDTAPTTPSSPPHSRQQSLRFLCLYTLAAAGGAIAYVPLLTILMPVRVEALAGDASVSWLSYLAFAGAIAASFANIAFGWLSDITRNRRGWIFAGMVLSSIMLVALTVPRTLPALIALIVMWQLSLNMMLGPLVAWAGDVVPNRQKGFLGGLLAFAPATGALSGALVTVPGLASDDARLALIAGLVVLCVSPVLLFGKPRQFPELTAPVARKPSPEVPRTRALVVRMWLARLLVQIAEAALFAFLYLWLRSISRDIGDDDAAQLFGIVLLMAVPVTMLVGRWADRHDRPILPLGAAAGVASVALLAMGFAPSVATALAAYAFFSLAASLFLSLHTAQTLRVLPKPQRRARDLGIFNLTNTVPSLIMPALTLSMVPGFGFSGLFLVLAALVGTACILLVTAPSPK